MPKDDFSFDFDDDFGEDLDIEDLLELNQVTQEASLREEEDAVEDKESALADLIHKIESGTYVSEAVRDVVFDSVKDIFDEDGQFILAEVEESSQETTKIIKGKKKELYELLENLDTTLKGKSMGEVAATFSSLLNIQSQLCMQKTDGVITIRTRLHHFFKTSNASGSPRPELQQEISLIFTPEEVKAIRVRLPEMNEEDPLYPFFSMVLDQAYDVVQYNELTGYLLLEMTRYFLHKLEVNGYGATSKTAEFKERHERSELSLKNAINELRDMERIINGHLRDRPVLLELPKLLRGLIQIKLGLLDKNRTPEILKRIYPTLGDYARARSAVAFDFNRLPSYQHGVRLRHSIILNLHKDVLEYTGTLFEQEFRAVKKEFEAAMKEIELSCETLQPDSPEYEEMLQKKAKIQAQLEKHRRKLDIVRSQEKLVDVQHSLVGEAIKRYQKNESQYQKLEDDLKSRAKIDPNKTRTFSSHIDKKKPSRMVMKRKIDR